MGRTSAGIAMLALVACSSFGDATPPTTTGADAAPPARADAAACTPKPLDLAAFLEHGSSTGTMTLADGTWTAVTTTATGTDASAFRELDLAPAASLSLAFDLGIGGVDGVYAEPACTVDLHHDPTNDRPVTELYFRHDTARSLLFAVGQKTAATGGQRLAQADLGTLAPILSRHDVALTVDTIATSRISGALTFDGKKHPFDVPTPGPVARIAVFCGIFYATGSFRVELARFRGDVCLR